MAQLQSGFFYSLKRGRALTMLKRSFKPSKKRKSPIEHELASIPFTEPKKKIKLSNE